jgi:AhpD family alkylhydroperoxidase
MQARMTNPAIVLPDAVKAVGVLYQAAHSTGLDPAILELVHLRASQINSCGPCVDLGARNAAKNGETPERLAAVAAWRETPYFTDAERAALNLAEAVTRLADRVDAVSDEIWREIEKHFDEKQRAALVVWLGTTNLFNRINVATRQQAPQSWN